MLFSRSLALTETCYSSSPSSPAHGCGDFKHHESMTRTKSENDMGVWLPVRSWVKEDEGPPFYPRVPALTSTLPTMGVSTSEVTRQRQCILFWNFWACSLFPPRFRILSHGLRIQKLMNLVGRRPPFQTLCLYTDRRSRGLIVLSFRVHAIFHEASRKSVQIRDPKRAYASKTLVSNALLKASRLVSPVQISVYMRSRRNGTRTAERSVGKKSRSSRRGKISPRRRRNDK